MLNLSGIPGLYVRMPNPVMIDNCRRGTTGSRRYSYLKFDKPLPENRQWQRIVNEVAREHDVDPSEILGKSRCRQIVEPRMIAMARCRREIVIHGSPASYPQIAKWFRRDHTSVINAMRKYPHV